MPFLAKCYNGHKILVDDDLEGETVECPVCEEEFVVTQHFEELGKVDEWTVPFNTKGYIHIATGLIIALLFTFIIQSISNNLNHFLWILLFYFTFLVGFFYFIRGMVELFKNYDPFSKSISRFYAYYYIILKKIKFFRR